MCDLVEVRHCISFLGFKDSIFDLLLCILLDVIEVLIIKSFIGLGFCVINDLIDLVLEVLFDVVREIGGVDLIFYFLTDFIKVGFCIFFFVFKCNIFSHSAAHTISIPEVMSKSCYERFAASCTDLIFRTRCRSARSMARCGDFTVCRVIAARTSIIRIPTDLGTRCRFCFVMLEIMAESVNDLFLAAQLFAANGAIDDFVIGAGLGAACRYFVLANGFAFGMTECFDFFIRCIVAAGAGIVGIPTDLGTRCRFCFVMLEIMPECINDLFLAAQLFAADGAVNDFVIRAGLGTACRYFVLTNGLTFGMTESISVLNAANFAFSGFGASCRAAAMACFVVDLVAAAAFVPMGSAVRRPLRCPIVTECGC